ncbi:MAG: tetratricopeptide repeat protein [Pelotomaculum sp. PtaU1.Bin035]|nr:MAG: tetratricopeptide repeat protein [Pelotomaculum sp. PtaU1.Bin035]
MKSCPDCGGQILDNAGLCGNCGNTKTQPEAAAGSPGSRSAGLGMKYKIIIGSVLAVLLVLGGFWSLNTYGTEARVQAKLELAVKYLSENKYEEAILAFNEAIRIDPRNMEARVGLAQAYIGIGDYQKAEEAVSTARGIGTIMPEQYQKLIAAYIKQGRLTEAERLLAEAREKYAANAFIADAEKLLGQEKAAAAALNNPPPAEPPPAPVIEEPPKQAPAPAVTTPPGQNPKPVVNQPDSGSVSNIY